MPSNKNTRENKRRELIFSRQNDKLKFSRSGETCETKQTTAFSAQTILRLECEEQRSRFFKCILEYYISIFLFANISLQFHAPSLEISPQY